MMNIIVSIVFILSQHKNKFQSHKRACENKIFCNIIMLSQNTKILEFNQYQKSDTAPFIIYAYLEFIIKNVIDVKIIQKIHPQQK